MTAILRSPGAMCAFASAVACARPASLDDPHVVPPVTGQAAITAWFDAGYYRAWQCEPTPHPAFMPSPHGTIRVCANPIVAGGGEGERPVDAALALEIVDARGAIVGHGAQRHTAPGTTGESWYWFMTVPPSSATPHDASGLAADGWGLDGPEHDVCSMCHEEAGIVGPGHDFVWALP